VIKGKVKDEMIKVFVLHRVVESILKSSSPSPLKIKPFVIYNSLRNLQIGKK